MTISYERRKGHGRRASDIDAVKTLEDVKDVLREIDQRQSDLDGHLQSLAHEFPAQVRLAVYQVAQMLLFELVRTALFLIAMLPPWWLIYSLYQYGWDHVWSSLLVRLGLG